MKFGIGNVEFGRGGEKKVKAERKEVV